MESKKILIVSFTFPPYSGIGGRRWAKFAKYLTKAGHKVEVIAGKASMEKRSPWINEIKGIEVSYLNTGYSKYLGIEPKSLIEKLMYRLSILYMKATTKGNYYDKSVKWSKVLKIAVQNKIKNNSIDIVFVTCAPFRMAYSLIPLLQQNRTIKWVVDFRDPWTTNRTAYGFESLSKTRQKFEINAEKEVVSTYDEVISVARPMTDYFKSLCSNQPQKFKTIYNGYDPNDFTNITKKRNGNGLNFIFAGNLYDKAQNGFKLFATAINELKKSNSSLYECLSFTFIGVNQKKIKHFSHPGLKVMPYLQAKEVINYLSKADIGLLFLTSDIDWSFSTKFTDYIGAQLKVLVVSESASQTGNYCEEKKLGYSYYKSSNLNLETILLMFLNDLNNKSTFPQRDEFNLSILTSSLLC